MKTKIKLTLLITTLYSTKLLAQVPDKEKLQKMKDSITMVYLTEMAKRQPLLRQGSLTTDFIAKGNIKSSTADDNKIYDGKLGVSRTKASFNVPISKWNKSSFNAGITYVRQTLTLGANNLAQNVTPSEGTLSTLGLAASYSLADSLLGNPVFYNASVSALTDELTSIQRLSYMGSVILSVKRTPNTMTNVGVIMMVTPNIIMPIPYFGYWHKFTNANLELNVEIPSNVTLRRPFSNRFWATFGTAIDGNPAFFQHQSATHSFSLLYETTELRTSFALEHMVGKKLVLGVRSGIINTVNNRLMQKNANRSDYLVKNKMGTVPFFNFSVSLLPFLVAKK